MERAGIGEEEGFVDAACGGAEQEFGFAGVAVVAGVGEFDFCGDVEATGLEIVDDATEFEGFVAGLEGMAGSELGGEAVDFADAGLAFRFEELVPEFFFDDGKEGEVVGEFLAGGGRLLWVAFRSGLFAGVAGCEGQHGC